MLQSPRLNILLIGATEEASAFIAGLLPALREPVCYREGRDFRPPGGSAGTLILHDAADMLAADQATMLVWLEEAHLTRVVTTVPKPLFPAVETGAFNNALYYRLNTITIHLSDEGTDRSPRSVARATDTRGVTR